MRSCLNDYTICIWARNTNALPDMQRFFSGAANDSGWSMGIEINSSPNLVCYWEGQDGVWSDDYPSGYTMPINTWTFFCMTHHYAGGTYTGTLWVNATNYSSHDFDVDGLADEDAGWCIGGDYFYGPYYQCFDGEVDEPLVFGRVLTAQEITNLYNAGAGSYGNTNNAPWNNGLICGWHLDEGTGTNLSDFSTNNSGGSVTGTTWINGKISIP